MKLNATLNNTGSYKSGTSLINEKHPPEWWVSDESNNILNKDIAQTKLVESSRSLFMELSSLFKDEHIIQDVEVKIKNNLFSRMVLTNFRLILLFNKAISTHEKPISRNKFSKSIEFSEIEDTEILKKSLKIQFTDNTQESIQMNPDILDEFKKSLDAARKNNLSLVNFEENEKISYKQPLYFDGNSTGVRNVIVPWEMVFGSESTKAKMCITNRRIILYRIEQIESVNQVNDNSASIWYAKYDSYPNWLTTPKINFVIIPISNITQISFEGVPTKLKQIKMNFKGPVEGWSINPYSFVIPFSLDDHPNAVKVEPTKNDSNNEYCLNLLGSTDKRASAVITSLRQIIPDKINISKQLENLLQSK